MKTQIEVQIEREAKELFNAPVIKPIVGQVARCHLCGAVCSPEDLQSFDTHLPSTLHRKACSNCHPERK